MAVTAGAIRAGAAYVELGTSDGPLVRGLRAAEGKVRAFGAKLAAMGGAMVSGGVMAAIPQALGARAFMAFETAMARVKALASPTGAEFDRLGKRAAQLGAETMFSATDAANAMALFARAGFDAKQILDATEPTLRLAEAAQLDMATAADVALKVTQGMGVPLRDMANAFDVMGKAATSGGTDVTQLGEAMKFVGPIAKTAGVGLEETVAAIQMLGKAGIQADMAGTTLRGMILGLSAPSEEAKAELKRLGVQVLDQRGNFRGLVAIVTDLEAALKGVGGGAKLGSLGTIFGARPAAGVAELVGQGGAALQAKTNDLLAASGTNAKIAAIQMDTLAGSWDMLTSSVEGVAIQLGQNIAPVLRSVGGAVGGVADAVSKWAGENVELFQSIAKTTMAVIGAGVAILGLGLALKVVGLAMGGLVAVFALAKAAVLFYFLSPILTAIKWGATFGYMLGSMEKAIGAVGVAVLAFAAKVVIAKVAAFLLTAAYAALAVAAFAMAHPVLAVVGALAAVGAGVYLAVSGFESLGRAMTSVKNLAAETARAVAERWGPVVQGIKDALAGGDMEAAAKIGFLGIKGEWLRLVSFLSGSWAKFLDDFNIGWDRAVRIYRAKALAGVGAISGEERDELIARAEADALGENALAKLKRKRAGKSGGSAIRANDAELAAAVAAAAANRELREWSDLVKSMGPKPEESILPPGLPDAAAAAAGAMSKAASLGTFSAFAAAQMGAGPSVAERIANNTDRTAKGIDELNKKKGGIVVG